MLNYIVPFATEVDVSDIPGISGTRLPCRKEAPKSVVPKEQEQVLQVEVPGFEARKSSQQRHVAGQLVGVAGSTTLFAQPYLLF